MVYHTTSTKSINPTCINSLKSHFAQFKTRNYIDLCEAYRLHLSNKLNEHITRFNYRAALFDKAVTKVVNSNPTDEVVHHVAEMNDCIQQHKRFLNEVKSGKLEPSKVTYSWFKIKRYFKNLFKEKKVSMG